MAARAGALIADPEFVQFHPTAVDVGRDPAPLATEALRGEGAIIVDRSGHRFMLDVHPDGELAPRDIVARAVHEAKISGRGAFLDCREAIGASFAERFPTVYAACMAAGVDPTRQPIPIAPAAHYHMGGVHVDGVGRTTLDGLWACGEVASTGAHGANRLASNSLLEAVVFAARVAEDIHGLLPQPQGDALGRRAGGRRAVGAGRGRPGDQQAARHDEPACRRGARPRRALAGAGGDRGALLAPARSAGDQRARRGEARRRRRARRARRAAAGTIAPTSPSPTRHSPSAASSRSTQADAVARQAAAPLELAS